MNLNKYHFAVSLTLLIISFIILTGCASRGGTMQEDKNCPADTSTDDIEVPSSSPEEISSEIEVKAIIARKNFLKYILENSRPQLKQFKRAHEERIGKQRAIIEEEETKIKLYNNKNIKLSLQSGKIQEEIDTLKATMNSENNSNTSDPQKQIDDLSKKKEDIEKEMKEISETIPEHQDRIKSLNEYIEALNKHYELYKQKTEEDCKQIQEELQVIDNHKYGILAKILPVEEASQKTTTITLDRGSNSGIKVGMQFMLFDERNAYCGIMEIEKTYTSSAAGRLTLKKRFSTATPRGYAVQITWKYAPVDIPEYWH